MTLQIGVGKYATNPIELPISSNKNVGIGCVLGYSGGVGWLTGYSF